MQANKSGATKIGKNNRASSFNTGIAAEYFVLSQLYRLGVEAYISQGNKKAIDIRVITKSGKPISLDVKAVRDYSSLIVNNITKRNDHFIVLLTYNGKFEEIKNFPEVFIVRSDKMNKIISHYKNEKRVLKRNLIEEGCENRWDLLT